MRYSQIRYIDVSNGEGIGVSLFTQGCRLRCYNCHNSSIWDFDGGKEYTKETEDKIIEILEPDYITRFSILGGEPLEPENVNDLYDLVKRVKEAYPDKMIWLYTGHTLGELMHSIKLAYARDILDYVDVLVDGRYIEELKDITLAWRGSSNQRVIDLPATLESNKVVLYCD